MNSEQKIKRTAHSDHYHTKHKLYATLLIQCIGLHTLSKKQKKQTYHLLKDERTLPSTSFWAKIHHFSKELDFCKKK